MPGNLGLLMGSHEGGCEGSKEGKKNNRSTFYLFFLPGDTIDRQRDRFASVLVLPVHLWRMFTHSLEENRASFCAM
jgi:hypothetical protein